MMFNDLYGETDVHGNTQLNASGGVDSIGRQPLSQVVTANGITYTTTDANGQPQQYVVALEQISIATNFNESVGDTWVHEAVCDPNAGCVAQVVQSVTLPNGQQYSFQYDSYGYITHITLPTGGTVDYQWANVGKADDASQGLRVVTQRKVYDGSQTSIWDFSYGGAAPAQAMNTTVLFPADANGVRAQSVYNLATQQMVSEVDYASAGGAMLRRFDMSYDDIYAVDGSAPSVLSAITTTLGNGLVLVCPIFCTG
jgi:YD repeat-containing protein